jgi:5-methylcytosine-specific restriction endonuclease McrA
MNKKEIRKRFRDSVFGRDKFTCRVCGCKRLPEDLDSHHVVDRSLMVNGGYVMSNGITVCKEVCHMKVELFHISGGKEWELGLHPDDLYRMIGSSKEKAIQDSINLK